MFTGIIEEVGTVLDVEKSGDGRRFRFSCSFANSLQVDESVSVNGVCLTAMNVGDGWFEAIAIEETLKKSALGEVGKSSSVNLERAMLATGRLDGHIVQGHVDGVGFIESVSEYQTSWEYVIRFNPDNGKYLIPKGSVTLDGISLTVAELSEQTFKVAIIPHTFDNTIVSSWAVGGKVNIEFDMIGKYVVGYMDQAKINAA
jgi:riboflavin synthase